MERVHKSAVPGKKMHLEIIRIIAIIFVIFNHTENWGFLYYTTTDSTAKYILSIIISIMCKVSVPLFFMISGALLTDREESIKDLFKRRIFKYAMVLVIFSFIQYLFIINRNPLGEFDIKEFIKGVYSSQIVGPYYFLYSYIAILFMLPFIRKMLRNMSRIEFIYLGVLQFVIAGLFPIIGYIGKDHYLNLSLFIIGNDIFFFMMGYFFEHKIGEEFYNKKNIVRIMGAGALCIAVSCFMTYFDYTLKGNYSQTFYMNLIAIPVFSFFCFWKYFCGHHSFHKKTASFILCCGSNAFGIYLIEDILRNESKEIYNVMSRHIDEFLACCIWVFGVWIAGNIIIYLIRKIPYLNKLI